MHETAHEWFGNNITTADIADMWVHESFANYSESLYTECRFGSAAGAEYVIGTRALIQNDAPIVGTYGLNARGSGDMYPKGGNMLHTIRHIIGDDARWTRSCGAQRRVPPPDRDRPAGAGVHHRPGRRAPEKVFDQYLTTTRFRRSSTVWTAPSSPTTGPTSFPASRCRCGCGSRPDSAVRLAPTEAWQTAVLPLRHPEDFAVDPNFYVIPRRAD